MLFNRASKLVGFDIKVLFQVGTEQETRLMHVGCKKCLISFGILLLGGGPQAPNNELGPTKAGIAWDTAPWDQAIQIN